MYTTLETLKNRLDPLIFLEISQKFDCQHDGAKLSIASILRKFGLNKKGVDIVISILAVMNEYENEIRRFGVWCAKQIPGMTTREALKAMRVAGQYANGKATAEDLGWANVQICSTHYPNYSPSVYAAEEISKNNFKIEKIVLHCRNYKLFRHPERQQEYLEKLDKKMARKILSICKKIEDGAS